MGTTSLGDQAVELLARLVRLGCVNDLTADSGEEERAVEVLEDFFDGVPVSMERVSPHPGRTTLIVTVGADATAADGDGAGPLTLGGNSELETRPYGPAGLSRTYGVTVAFTPIEDSGGPLTVKALRDGDIQLANIYSSDPALADGTLTVLADPQGLFLASHVVPLASARVDDEAAAVINRVSAALEPADLVEMNRASTQEQRSASQIAREWLSSKGLLS